MSAFRARNSNFSTPFQQRLYPDGEGGLQAGRRSVAFSLQPDAQPTKLCRLTGGADEDTIFVQALVMWYRLLPVVSIAT